MTQPPLYLYIKKVTIQNYIRKTAVSQRSLPHVVTSPYKLCQMSLRMRAFDVHIVIICMALNSYMLYYMATPGSLYDTYTLPGNAH